MYYGGYWDKIGNEFEDLWALRQLVLLASPFSDIESLEREPVGDDERGVDLWVNRKDGTRECYQCKSENQDRPSWSMAALRKEKVLEHLQFQISRDPQRHRYRLVSGAPATLFKRLCDEARDSRDAATFWRDQILPVKGLQRAIGEFCEALGLSSISSTDQELVWILLGRSSFILFRVDEEQFQEMADRFSVRVDGNPKAALQALASWLRGKRRCKIEIQEIEAYLASIGFRLSRSQTDAYHIEIQKYTQRRREQKRLLEVQAELLALQDEIMRQAVDQVHVIASKWRLVRRIGGGGFAEVWQGEDQELQESDREPVAVKILKRSDPAMVERFYQGGRVAASIGDLKLPQVLVGPTEADGLHFYVMEYVEGKNLSSWLSTNQLPMQGAQERAVLRNDPAYGEAAWRIFFSVGEALVYLHKRGLIHGDVKPENILVNRSGMVKLCDFDLFRTGTASEGSLVPIGTVPYLAPEVLAGEEASTLSDQYSLAMTAVAIIHGHDDLRQIGPCVALLHELSCSIAVKRNLERALALEPQNRFETVEEFMNNLGPEAFEAVKV